MKISMQRMLMLLAALLLAFALLPGVTRPVFAQSGVCTVTSPLDDGSAGTLRALLADAACATITFDGDYTIQLASPLTLTRAVTIDGGAHTVTLSGDTNGDGTGNVRVLIINSGVTATLQNLTVTKGFTTGNGAGLTNSGTAVVSHVTFSDNHASIGGGLLNYGTLTVTNSTISGSNATTRGGGLYTTTGTAEITNSTFAGNSTTGYAAGAIWTNSGTVTITNSTFSGNSAANRGGAIFTNGGTVNITNSTFAGNSATIIGGALYTYGGVTTITSSTFSNNTASASGGIQQYGGSTVSISNTIFVASRCYAWGDIHHILSDDGSCTIDRIGSTTIGLGTLGNYGGPTQTIPLLSGSAAIDAGDPATCPATDQRGFSRAGACDIGAYEYEKAENDFVITVNTNFTTPGKVNNTQFTIPTYPGETYNYNVDCNNDGVNEVTGATGDYTCNYPAAGTYTVRIKDNTGLGTGFPRIYFNNGGDKYKLLTIEQWGKGKWTSMNNAFKGCSNLAGQASDSPDLSGVTDLSGMFSQALRFNQDISAWNTASVTNMSGMFANASFNQPIGSWNTANVTNMSYMFRASRFNQPIGSWNTASVTDMSYMFHSSAFNQDISGWDTSHVTDMKFMFAFGGFNQDISGWDTSKVTDMSAMFYKNYAFNQPIGTWNTASVTVMDSMFGGASSFNQNLGGWKVGALTNASGMFYWVTLSNANYEALLKGWSAQTLQPGVTFDGGSSQYCAAGAAHNTLTAAPNSWVITDGGTTCSVPSVTTQPQSQSVLVGDTASFSAAASGSPAPTVQWQVSTDAGATWTDLAGQTGATLSFTAAYAQNGDQYRALFTNDAGSATTDAATLTVSKKTAVCTISGWSGPYDGQPHGASGTCTGTGGVALPGLDLGATFTNVPGGPAHWTFSGGSDYTDQSGDVAIVIEKAIVKVYLPILMVYYDGSPKPVTVTTDPDGLNTVVTYDGTTTPPFAVGSYAVVATVDDPNYQGSASGTLVIAPVADLSLVNLAKPDPVKPGAALTYTLKLTNLGPNDAQNVVIIDTLDANVTYVSYKAPKGWTCSVDAGVVTCTSASLASGSNVSIAIYVTVKKTAPLKTTLANTALVSSDTYDPVVDNNTATQKTLVSK